MSKFYDTVSIIPHLWSVYVSKPWNCVFFLQSSLNVNKGIAIKAHMFWEMDVAEV